MTETKNHNHAADLAHLAWLVEMGADEAIGDTPVDRFAASAERMAQKPAAATVQSKQILSRTAPRPPAPSATAPAAKTIVSAQDAQNDARGLAGAASSLADIEAALAQFDACPLKRTASNLCFSDGNLNARVMFIGEAPGRDEDIQGKPFVGRSGQLLDKMLSAICLDRNSESATKAAFITNVIYWRPPGNRKPTEAETLMCMPFVERTIELQAPQIIVCLGGTPMQRLTGRSEGILKSRGRWMEFEVAGRKIPLIATLHPAYLLRQPAQKRLAWRDFVEISKRLASLTN